MTNGLTAADRLILLAVRDVSVSLTEPGQLDVQGPATVILAAIPMLRMHKAELVRELKRIQKTDGVSVPGRSAV